MQTRGVRIDPGRRTGCAYMKVRFEEGRMKMETVREAAEDSLLANELNLAVLKEVVIVNVFVFRPGHSCQKQ